VLEGQLFQLPADVADAKVLVLRHHAASDDFGETTPSTPSRFTPAQGGILIIIPLAEGLGNPIAFARSTKSMLEV
jgi:hypothetical protein